MKKLKYIKSAVLLFFCAVFLTTGSCLTDTVSAQPAVINSPVSSAISRENVKPLDVVNSPSVYLNKKVVMLAQFDKFSTLGLDYKPAYKSSDDYISFLIKRDDTPHDIPLSEMKLFLKRDIAEKFLELKTNDKIQITGTVFSDALGDAWVDVENLTIIEKAPDKDGVK